VKPIATRSWPRGRTRRRFAGVQLGADDDVLLFLDGVIAQFLYHAQGQAGADDTVEYAKNKWTVKLDDRLARWKDWSGYFGVPREATKFEAHTTGIPAQIRPRAPYIRKDLFDKRGVKVDAEYRFHGRLSLSDAGLDRGSREVREASPTDRQCWRSEPADERLAS
jgi:hypothetical protein